ncbi:DUF3626 domain-containing protein [Reyranella sp. CPCC 100927]|uniref:DUF3626 domain-containing protein n=1 Tax=Reyranella sp. CPCC 100927 TaxID=2599616 RepID=UPI0011B72284|nr:DUF3626 domain-containing protein [Reyranella sp. CPCC 100927]TWT11703.1 DUF3626 domain-containing protein [Reyranella sp. CPCC 100927]
MADPSWWERQKQAHIDYMDRGGLPGTLFSMLPRETQSSLRPWGEMLRPLLNPLEWTPGAAVRDTMQASGDLFRAVVAGDPWGSIAAGGSMALAALPGPGPKARPALPPASTRSELLSVDQALRLRPVVIATDRRGAEGILREGQFRSQHETGTSRGRYDPSLRAEFEEKYLGVPGNTPPEKRPVYGSLGLAPGMPEVTGPFGYGPYVFTLKPEVKNRATYTLGDSLDDLLMARDWNLRGSGKRATRVHPYIEAQISRLQQPVTLNDVDRLLIANPLLGSSVISRETARRGIPYNVMPHPLALRPGHREAIDWWRQFGLMAPPVTFGALMGPALLDEENR